MGRHPPGEPPNAILISSICPLAEILARPETLGTTCDCTGSMHQNMTCNEPPTAKGLLILCSSPDFVG